MKPVNKNQETAQRELEEAMKKVKEAQSLILAAVEPGECHTPVYAYQQNLFDMQITFQIF